MLRRKAKPFERGKPLPATIIVLWFILQARQAQPKGLQERLNQGFHATNHNKATAQFLNPGERRLPHRKRAIERKPRLHSRTRQVLGAPVDRTGAIPAPFFPGFLTYPPSAQIMGMP